MVLITELVQCVSVPNECLRAGVVANLWWQWISFWMPGQDIPIVILYTSTYIIWRLNMIILNSSSKFCNAMSYYVQLVWALVLLLLYQTPVTTLWIHHLCYSFFNPLPFSYPISNTLACFHCHLRTAYFCYDTLFAHCWPCACLWNLLFFWPLAKPCKWQCLSAKLTLWMLTSWLVQRPCTSKLLSLCLLCSIILTNFLVFTYQHNIIVD